jgi:hypothetical protein
LAGVVNGMLGKRTNAYVEAMNGLLQQVKRAARGFRTAKNFIAIAHLRMGLLVISCGTQHRQSPPLTAPHKPQEPSR